MIFFKKEETFKSSQNKNMATFSIWYEYIESGIFDRFTFFWYIYLVYHLFKFLRVVVGCMVVEGVGVVVVIVLLILQTFLFLYNSCKQMVNVYLKKLRKFGI